MIGVVGDQLAGCSIENATAVVETLAQIHAMFWKSDIVFSEKLEMRSIAPASRLKDPDQLSSMAIMLGKGASAYRAMLKPNTTDTNPIIPNNIPEETFELLDRASTRGMDLLFAVAPKMNTLCHQDVRLDNIVLVPKYDVEGGGVPLSSGVILLDWQRYSLGWGMTDFEGDILIIL